MSDDAALRELLSSACAVDSGNLADCPAAVPLPAQTAIVADAIATARRHGLVLPRFEVKWVAAPPGYVKGQTTLHADGRITVHFNVQVLPGDLALTCLHEARHIADFGAGLRLDSVELETRAVEFAARCLGWR